MSDIKIIPINTKMVQDKGSQFTQKFNKLGNTFEKDGADGSKRKYCIVDKRIHEFSGLERFGRGCLGAAAVICTLGTSLISKSVRNLFTKSKENTYFAVECGKPDKSVESLAQEGNKYAVMVLVRNNAKNLEIINETMKSDKDFMAALLVSNYKAKHSLEDKWTQGEYLNEDILFKAIAAHPNIAHSIPERWRNDSNFLLNLAEKIPKALDYLGDDSAKALLKEYSTEWSDFFSRVKGAPALIKMFIKQNHGKIEKMPPKDQQLYKDAILGALETKPELFEKLCPALQQNTNFLFEGMVRNPKVLKHINADLRQDQKLLIKLSGKYVSELDRQHMPNDPNKFLTGVQDLVDAIFLVKERKEQIKDKAYLIQWIGEVFPKIKSAKGLSEEDINGYASLMTGVIDTDLEKDQTFREDLANLDQKLLDSFAAWCLIY